MNNKLKYCLGSALIILTTFAQAQPVVLINTFSVYGDKDVETLAYWEEARAILEKQPGYISTSLHRSLSQDATYRYINVAQWSSQQHFMDAINVMRNELPALSQDGIAADPNLYEVIRN
ncbi:antibiotic biosynthesis monooxygenase [Vibrio sp. D404a]|uniref:antibiotic biosynthesis monooxygenase family protein n=1 Tax=unclassified Vibrio TaxID=2614977 RepID=UPI002555CCFE|nr:MULTISPECIES: antibiotic biosynthesis monooxygenase family protein [unclassified Vibrio]MDK9739000.1 antibiotic biosynthesis monooxygenase [Vibrio sp. D404a]MDK9799536.1 antibiotic biosynthesis monooxygenase [Vibrio sp. D449a]